DLEATKDANNWKIGIDIPSDYRIDQVYGAKLTQEAGKTYLSGESWNESRLLITLLFTNELTLSLLNMRLG
ncbi:MAG: hypothetical protein AAFO85_19345, partial [Cyanobacteria bacterium J06598_4]